MARSRKWIPLIWIAATTTLWGCADEQAAKEIAKLRKAGHRIEAREQAADVLRNNGNRMLVWRELAYTDEALSRDQTLSQQDQLRCLKEAALVCAAVCAHDQQMGKQSDYHWTGLANLLRMDLTSRMTAILGTVKIHPRDETTHSVTIISEDLEPLLGDLGTIKRYQDDHNTWFETDPAEAQQAIRLYSQLRPLVLRLPLPLGESHGNAMGDLQNWADSRYLKASTVQNLYDAGEKTVATAYAQALEDLQDLGFLQAATIFQSALLTN